MKIILLVILAIVYPMTLHFTKEKLNEWIDLNWSHVVGRCRYCRGFHFGSIQGFIYAFIAYLLLK